MLTVTASDVDRITGKLFLSLGDRKRNLSAFWTLLVLAAVIASAGVVADSTATVIGAMIVAPLMTPILGTALAIVLADRHQLGHSIALVLGASASVVAVGYAVGLTVQLDVVAATNSQVAGRISPRLIDLVAAVATGLVGAFALVRSDVSDTLPGVAIAISLVPPLAVVGLTLESGAYDEAAGALLLWWRPFRRPSPPCGVGQARACEEPPVRSRAAVHPTRPSVRPGRPQPPGSGRWPRS